jgi:hypothetical protein
MLRTPTHRLRLGSSRRAMGDLVFVDRVMSHTSYRTCVQRRIPKLATCFDASTADDDVANVTPLRFGAGEYRVQWKVGGVVVATWRFTVS